MFFWGGSGKYKNKFEVMEDGPGRSGKPKQKKTFWPYVLYTSRYTYKRVIKVTTENIALTSDFTLTLLSFILFLLGTAPSLPFKVEIFNC